MSRAPALALALLLASGSASAAPADAKKLSAEAVELLAKGDVAGAVERFEQAVAEEPSAPLLFNLGQAQAKLGRLLDAERSLVRAGELAKQKGPKSIVSLADDALAQVRARLPRLIVDLPDGAEGARIEIDGKRVDARAEGTTVDPGRHELAVEADGFLRFTRSFEAKERESTRIAPKLVRKEKESSPDPRAEPAEPAARNLTGPLVLGGAGLLALGGATYFYLRMSSIEDERRALWAESRCPGPSCPDGEPPRASELREDSEQNALFGNVLAIAGGAALVGAGVWYFLSGGDSEQAARTSIVIAPAPGGASVSGRF